MNQSKCCHALIVWTLITHIGIGLLCIDGAWAQGREKIAYRLKWLINASTAGDVFAKKQGRFEANGMDVSVKAGGPERDAIRELELGYAQFGVASADQVIRALSKGAKIIVLAQLFQTNSLQWIYRADLIRIQGVEDLIGRSVGITYGGNDETIMRALLAGAGIEETQVRLTGVRYDYTPFLRNRVQVWPVYRNTQGIYLADKLAAGGEQVAFFDPSGHGVRFVANSVITSQKMVDKKPRIVRRFIRALLAGWQAAMDPANEAAVVRTVAEHDRETPHGVIRRQLAATRRMVRPDDQNPLGHIDVSAWQQTEAIMVQQGLVPGPVNILERLKYQLSD